MKKLIAISMILLTILSTLAMFAPQIKAQEELLSLPAGATNSANGRDTETILLSIDVDSKTSGDQQVVTASPGETIIITATFQVWSSGGPGIIKQAFFIYSWTPSWPPLTAYYIPLYNGQPGYHPGVTLTKSFSVTVPQEAGNHYLWFCLGAHYSMELAVNEYKTPLSLPAHAKIVVTGTPPSDKQLTTNPLDDDWPSWSPDGTKIVYYAFAGSWYRHIWVMNNDGTSKTQLTSGSVVDEAPAYSPDGTKIAFQRWGFRGDYFDLMMMDADGSNVQRITHSGIPGKKEGTFGYPRWSEDGTKLVFHYGEGTTGHGSPITAYWICTINVDGTGLEVLGRGEVPRFCYGDTKILFNTDPRLPDGRRIALMNADGTGVQILTDGPNDGRPHMSSTTSRILFLRAGDIYVMNEDESNLASITSDGTIGFAEWSPDEKYIVYSSEKSGNRDIWKMEAPPEELYSLPAGAKHWVPSEPVLDETKLLIDIDIAGQGQTAYVSPGETVSGSCTYQIYAPVNPSEINQGFFIMSWTPSWPAPEGYYIPIWNGISGLYPGTGERTESFSFTAPSTLGTYYLYWCRQAHYTMRQAVDTYDQPLTLPAHAKIIVGERPDYTELINKYFPHLIFDEEEEYFPTNFYYLDQNIDNNPTDYDKDTWPLTAYVHTVEGRWLDRASFSFLPPEEKDYLVIEYWFYYAKDTKAWDIPILGAHDHDWESVFIFLEKEDPEPEPSWVVYFHHSGGVWWIGDKQDTYYLVRYENPHCPACAVEKVDGTHPVVHVARDSHASYPKTIAGMSPLQTVYVPVPSVGPGPPIDFVKFYYSEPCDGGRVLDYNDFQIVTVQEPDPEWPTMFGEIPAPWAPERTRWNDPGYLLQVVEKLAIIANSPLNLLVTSPDGLHVGYDPETESVVNEIMGVEYSGPGTDPQIIAILNPIQGVHIIDVLGTGTGDYTITMEFMAADGSVTGTETYTGATVEGAVYVYTVSITDEAMTTSPDPIAELEHLKEFVMNLPDDAFVSDDPDEFLEFKKEMVDKIDETLEELDENKYTEAIEKLNDMREEVIDEDGLQSSTQSDLCVIIDHIISSLEMLQQETQHSSLGVYQNPLIFTSLALIGLLIATGAIRQKRSRKSADTKKRQTRE